MSAVLAKLPAQISREDLITKLRALRDGLGYTSVRKIIALAGPPGAGKSTLAEALVAALNHGAPQKIAALVPMDGFHYDNDVLDALNLRAKKGAPETFDALGLIALLKRIRADEDNPIAVPIFDRARDVAKAGAALITPQQRLIIVEGNHLLLRQAPWDALSALFDVTIMLRPPRPLLEARLIQRWQSLGLDEAAVQAKVYDNDLPNADFVFAQSQPADFELSF